MGRCKKKRCCRILDGVRVFKPTGIPMGQLQIYEIEPDEFEAIRLCDLEGKNQIEASGIMCISRGTVQRLLSSGRSKIAQALLNKQAIRIKDLNE